ncbi:sigma-70 family RNA polymerase sigma factor [Albimonas sp. CAU 1670]|uniref:RNA polymerase sigma factor n=1 Tax=Albimonas sp. CAU 1670 TaxID=3032599 RepID=UPI0023DA6BEF|nr:sigma-70 family RNA polymerase sigma factor [Albimonas sp. CAU 1670]MDF2235784.1 sigma-70 family RNA polymerase sigma factor [Albimonas sp. CAU 1670]
MRVPDIETMDLAGLLAATAEGDKPAFAELYRRTSAKLYGVILRICRRPDLAAELLQESYLKIWTHAGRFDPGRASPIAWMAAIARNRTIDAIRLQAERVSAASDQIDPPDGSGEGPGLAAAAGLDQTESLALRECLEGLKTDDRRMVLLGYLYGLSREELGERFAMPVNTVKTRLRRALSALKGCLDGEPA